MPAIKAALYRAALEGPRPGEPEHDGQGEDESGTASAPSISSIERARARSFENGGAGVPRRPGPSQKRLM